MAREFLVRYGLNMTLLYSSRHNGRATSVVGTDNLAMFHVKFFGINFYFMHVAFIYIFMILNRFTVISISNTVKSHCPKSWSGTIRITAIK